MDVPFVAELQQLYAAFHESTSSAKLTFGTCAICGRHQQGINSGIAVYRLYDISNRHLLIARPRHLPEEQVAVYLLVQGACYSPPDGKMSQMEVDVCK